MEFTQEIHDRFMKCDPAAIGHFVGRGFMRPNIKPVTDEMKVVGPAYTVRLTARDSSALYYAIQKAPKGSVLVVDRAGDHTFACIGEFVAVMAQVNGIAGLVIDGPATDKRALKMSNFPVFCTGFSPVTSNVTGPVVKCRSRLSAVVQLYSQAILSLATLTVCWLCLLTLCLTLNGLRRRLLTRLTSALRF